MSCAVYVMSQRVLSFYAHALMCYVVSCRSRLSCFHMLSCVVVSIGHCVCVDHAPLVCVGIGWGMLDHCGSMLSWVGCGLRWDDVG